MDRWTTLKPQSADKLVKLDLDSLLDLFEAAGITLSDEDALSCLQSLPCNLIGRHSVHDVVVWLRRHTLNSSSPSSSAVGTKRSLPLWRTELFQYRERFLGWLEWIQRWVSKINHQDLSFKEVQRCRKKLLQEKINSDSNALASPTATAAAAVGKSSSTTSSSSGLGSKKSQKSSAFENILKGSIRLSGWQRHRQMSRPAKCGFMATFGPPIVSKALPTATKKPSNTLTSILKTKTEPKPDYRGRISLEFFTKPEGKKRETLVSGDGIVKDFDSVTPGDLMSHFDRVGYVVELSEAEIASQAAYAAARAAGLSMSGAAAESSHASGSKPSAFIAWFLFRVADSATAHEAFCLLKTATNFFESIPLDYRHEIYTSTKGQLFYLEPNSTLTPIPSPSAATATPGPSAAAPVLPRFVCVALLHDRDPYKVLEDQIKATNLLYTRALRSLKINFRCVKTLRELYDESCEFDQFQERLFGPQEDELGEEGMNPLRFAKMCRKRQLAAQEAIEKAPTMPLEELKLHLSTRGLSSRGTKDELIARVQKAFHEQSEMIGYGEMSSYGAQMVQRIFEMFDLDQDGAWSLMEMNQFLLVTGMGTGWGNSTGTGECFYDTKAYKSMMLEEGLLLDSQYRLTLEGLTAYYERYGRLARDINLLGLGSLSHSAQGEVEVRVEYESDAIHSLYGILESHSLAQRSLKHLLGMISSSNEILLTGKFDRLEDLLTLLKCDHHEGQGHGQGQDHSEGQMPFLKEIFEGIRRPGWISHLIHKHCEWLADGEEGLVPSLRANSKAKLNTNNFSNFTKPFQRINAPATRDPRTKPSMRGGDESEEGEEESTEISSATSYGTTSGAAPPGNPGAVREESIDSFLQDPSLRREYANMFQIFYKNNKLKPIDATPSPATATGAGGAHGDDEDESERYLPLPPRHPEIERWIEQLDAILPRIIAYSSKKTLMNEEIQELLTSAANLYNRLSGNERLTRTERDKLQFLKLKCERRAEKLLTQLEESVHLCGAHFLSFYDALRLYGEKGEGGGIAQFGCGTAEMSLKINLIGMDWLEFLPEGLGEACAVRQKENEKIERAMQRKNAALSAIERERLRRDLDEEEREKRRLWEIANAQLARDEEEKTLFDEVYSLLLEAREETRVAPQDVEEMITAWKKLLEMREGRYPDSLKVAVTMNDLACVLMELCADRPISVAEAVSYFRSSAEISMKFLESILKREVSPSLSPSPSSPHSSPPSLPSFISFPLSQISITEGSLDAKAKFLQLLNDFSPPPPTPPPQETSAGPPTAGAFLKKDATLASTDGVRHAFAPNSPASFLLLLLNYLTSLRLSKNLEELHDDFCQRVKEALFILHGLLSDKEQSTIHLERRMELFVLFPLGDVKDNLQKSLGSELEEHRKQHHVRVEKEKLKKRLEEFKGVTHSRKEGVIMTKGDQQIGMEMLALVDPKKAARIKFHRQQKEARKKRTQSIQERNKMYRMIASDEISALFFQQAKKTDESSELEWGDDKLLVVEDPLKRGGVTGGEGEGDEGGGDQQSEASDDSFASKLKKVKRKVDTSLANVQFEPNKPMYVKSPGRAQEGDHHDDKAAATATAGDGGDGGIDTKSEHSSAISELTTPANFLNLSDPTKSIRRESRILSWLTRNRGGK
jgi:hypothetical protein